MSTLDSKKISERIYEFLKNKENVALFAGAGVGARAGLPTWTEFMEILAKEAEKYEPDASALIRKYAEQGHYLSAATTYKICPNIPLGEKLEKIAFPFRNPPFVNKLEDLISLPFNAISTTNYDRSLHDSFAATTGKAPQVVELNDATMKEAPFFTEFYIARVHGREEVPETIILSKDDYRKIKENKCYIDFICHIFTRFKCIFIGFSFLDPAIESIFEIIEERFSPHYPELHIALLPDDTDPRLKSRLLELNIRTFQYEKSTEHSELWKGIELAAQMFKKEEEVIVPKVSFPLDPIKRFVATSYARTKMEKELEPLRDMVIEGIILDILINAGSKGMSFQKVSNNLKRLLFLSNEESENLLHKRIKKLSERDLCHRIDETIFPTKNVGNFLELDIQTLIDGVINRIEVREGQKVTSQLVEITKLCLEEVLIARGWDLGAHYAKAKKGEIPNIINTISLAAKTYGTDLPPSLSEAFIYACFDLFQRPDQEESIVLSELGRVAFALNLIINIPCATLALQEVLPERIYFDSNFLMPLIVKGHPFHSLYNDTVNRFREAANDLGVEVTITVGKEFLNEIISHRKRAQMEVESMFFENKDDLDDYILYSGSENVNVFIGAYSNWEEREKRNVSFYEFLNHFAPYKTEEDLAKFLKRLDIETIDLSFRPGEDVDLFHRVLELLIDRYNSNSISIYDRKEEILINHEARQLTRLLLDLKKGYKTLFITADMRLQRLAHGNILEEPGNAIISNRSFIQLIDIILGLRGDPAVTTKLFWASSVPNEEIAIRNYFINHALKQRDEIMTRSFPDVLNETVKESIDKAKSEGVSLYPGKGSYDNEIHKTRLLDSLEDKFYANMANVIHQKFPDEFNYALKTRRELLEKNITKIKKLIENSSKKLDISDDPLEISRIKKELYELRKYLEKFNKNAKEIEKK